MYNANLKTSYTMYKLFSFILLLCVISQLPCQMYLNVQDNNTLRRPWVGSVKGGSIRVGGINL